MFLGRKNRKSLRPVRRPFQMEALEVRRVLDGDALELSRFGSAAEVEEFLINDAIERYTHLFDQPYWSGGIWFPECFNCEFFAFDDAIAPPAAPGAAPGAEPAPDHSDTNTQVEGVDEADIVETDGNYIYTLSGQELIITDAWEPHELEVVSRFPLEGQPVGEFLHGDRLTVITNEYSQIGIEPWIGGAPLIDIDVAFFGGHYQNTSTTQVTVFDVADRTNPQVIHSTELDGSYVSSRAIGDHVYVVSNTDLALPYPELECGDEADTESCFYESQESYIDRVSPNVFELGTPQFTTENAFGLEIASGALTKATDIFKPELNSYANLITVSTIDSSLDSFESIPSISAPSSYSTTVYASSDSIYLTNPDWGSAWGPTESTSILKFDIVDEGSRVDLATSGIVPGRLLNSFSMDEYTDAQGDAYFRVATSTGWGRNTDNRVYVMQQSDEGLSVVGQTESLAPGEQIFSVRYNGTTAYVVTFVQTDPLFTIDLTEPTDPQVLGELHVTGFSNYLQKVSDDFLLGLGREADPETGRAQELQISLFDVADLTDPTLAARYSFDVPGWAWSEAIGDHHALSYFPDHQVLTIPVSNDGLVWVDRDFDGNDDFQMYRPRTDLYMFHLDLPEQGANEKADIQFLGTVEHDANVRRSVRIEDYLYAVSDDSISVLDMNDIETEIARVHFGQDDVGAPVLAPEALGPTTIIAIESPEATAPQVTGVRVASSQWEPGIVNYLDLTQLETDSLNVIPFNSSDEIKLQFSEDVFVEMNDLKVTGSGGSYALSGFKYDVENNTAIWTLANPLETVDQVQVRLSSGVRDLAGNRLDGNANGTQGGVFQYTFNVLPGDVDRDGRVDAADLRSAMSRATADSFDDNYVLSNDVDGSGRIDIFDFEAISNRAGTTLPNYVPPVIGDANGDGRFDNQDLIQVMQEGMYGNGEFATFSQGDWNRDGFFDQSDFVHVFQSGTYQINGAVAARLADDVFGGDDLFDDADDENERMF